jgi:flagellar motor switch protein FliM
MSQDQTLSGEEISALISEAREGGPAGESASAGPARAFSLGGDAGRTMAAIPALDRLNERMVKRLREVIEPFARAKPRVETLATEVRAFGDWRAEQSEFVSLSLYGFRPLKGAILLRIEPEFISRLVDAFYGGNGTAPNRRAREFTATEESLLGRLCEALIGALAEGWSEIIPVRPQLRARETNAGFAGVAKADEMVAVARFTISPWPGHATVVEIVYPVAGLRSIEPELAAQSHDDATAKTGEWRERLGAAVGEVRIEARTVLARPELSLAELMQLQVGDILPVSLSKLVPLIVAGRRIALGTVGEHDGRAALKIEKMEQRIIIS